MEFGSTAILAPGPLIAADAVFLWFARYRTISPATNAFEFESWAPFRNTEPVLFTTATPAFCAKATGTRTISAMQMRLE
jgi:hypothetical protein